MQQNQNGDKVLIATVCIVLTTIILIHAYQKTGAQAQQPTGDTLPVGTSSKQETIDGKQLQGGRW